MDCIQIVPPPPPALGLFNNDSNDELLKTIISQSSCQTESSTTTETGAAGDTGNYGAAAAPPTHAHSEQVPTVISKTSNNMATAPKCLAAERFATSLKQQSHSIILDNSNCKLPSTLPQQRYVCYGYKPDGIRLSNERTTLPSYSSAGSSHHVKFNYQNMPITPIVIETNSNRMDKDSGSSSSMGSQGSNCIASNNSSSSCAEKYFFNGATNNYALASLLSQQSCQNFYRNLHKSPRFPPWIFPLTFPHPLCLFRKEAIIFRKLWNPRTVVLCWKNVNTRACSLHASVVVTGRSTGDEDGLGF